MCLQLFIIRRLGSGTVIYIIKHHPVFCNADKPVSDPKAGNSACVLHGIQYYFIFSIPGIESCFRRQWFSSLFGLRFGHSVDTVLVFQAFNEVRIMIFCAEYFFCYFKFRSATKGTRGCSRLSNRNCPFPIAFFPKRIIIIINNGSFAKDSSAIGFRMTRFGSVRG